MFVTGLDNTVVDWCPGAEAIFGWTAAEIIGRSAEVLFTPEDCAAGVPARELQTAMRQGCANDERWHVRRDGTRFFANGSVRPLHDASGAVNGFIKIALDETERRAVEDRLRASEEFTRRILSSSADCIKVLDLDARLEFMSEGGMCVMEIDDFGAVEGSCWPDFWKGDEHALAQEAVDEAKRGGTGRFQGFATTYKGTPRWWDVIVTAMVGPDGKPEKLLSISRDITANREAETRLRELNDTLEQQVAERTAERDHMWNSSPDLMLVLDFEGIFRRVNPAWTTMLGYSPKELIGHHVNEFVIEDDHDATVGAYEQAAGGGSPRVQIRYRHKDGSTRTISWAAAPATDLIYATGRDVTSENLARDELELAQAALRQAQKMEAVGQLTGGVAHDFNNLLTVIRGSTDLLRRPNLPKDRRKVYIDAISDTADRAAKVTSQLLAFARRQALKPELFDAVESLRVIRDMVGTLTGSRIIITLDLHAEPCFISADRSQFETAIVNMAVNARDAMNAEGNLTIKVNVSPGIPATRAHAPVEGPFVIIALTDTGSGIAPSRLDRIFEPFFTTKSVGHGTGLGLSQVFGFAKQSGGNIRVESVEGQGSTFIMYLPLVEAPQQIDKPATDTWAPSVGEGACILVVEDNPEVGEFATAALNELGYQTELAPNAMEALAKLAAGASDFDVVFTDVVMPGMSGIDLAKQIASLYPNLPVILTSGFSDVLAQDGVDGYRLLSKPYSIEELSAVLREVAKPA